MLNNFYRNYGKRIFDFTCVFCALLLIYPILIIIALLVKLTSKGPVIFAQARMGQNFSKFYCYKFRTMVQDAPKLGLSITAANDPRITKIGRLLRKTKLDELPQLLNVLKGDMSLVGPRPEVEKYVLAEEAAYREILKVKPGITDFAAIVYCDEEKVLSKYTDKEAAYLKVVLPAKIKLYKRYIRSLSFMTDLKVILLTLKRIIVK